MAEAHLASTINSVAAGLQPVIEPVKQQLLEVASAAADAVAPHVRPWYQTADAYLQGLPPVQVALLAATGTLVITLVAARIAALWQRVRSRGLLQLLFGRLKQLPIIRGLYAKQLAGIRQKIAATLHKQEPVVAVLPAQGKPAAAVMALLKLEQGRASPPTSASPAAAAACLAPSTSQTRPTSRCWTRSTPCFPGPTPSMQTPSQASAKWRLKSYP